MTKADGLGIVGSLFLLAMAWYDRDWRWFWAVAGGVMLAWCLWAAVGPRRVN